MTDQPSTQERCRVKSLDGVTCTLKPGHLGLHANGDLHWTRRHGSQDVGGVPAEALPGDESVGAQATNAQGRSSTSCSWEEFAGREHVKRLIAEIERDQAEVLLDEVLAAYDAEEDKGFDWTDYAERVRATLNNRSKRP